MFDPEGTSTVYEELPPGEVPPPAPRRLTGTVAPRDCQATTDRAEGGRAGDTREGQFQLNQRGSSRSP